MPYVALKRLLVEGNIVRMPGDLVPEAEHWKNLRAYLGSHVKEVDAIPEPEDRDPTPSFSVAEPLAAKPAAPRNASLDVPTPRGAAGRGPGRPKKVTAE